MGRRTRLICVVVAAQPLADIVESLDHVDFVVARTSFGVTTGSTEGDEGSNRDEKYSWKSHGSHN